MELCRECLVVSCRAVPGSGARADQNNRTGGGAEVGMAGQRWSGQMIRL